MNEITVKATLSGRTAYPVAPDPDNPVILQIDGQLIKVLDISANGFTLPADAVDSGRRYPFNLDLPTGRQSIEGYVDVLPETQGDSVRCLFADLRDTQIEALHQYVLVRQKAAIRALRAHRAGLS